LENTIECAVALGSQAILQVDDLPSNLQKAGMQPVPENHEPLNLNQIEEIAIFKALDETGDDKLEAARLLGIGKSTLYRRLKDHRRNLKSA
jgi:transcriptional regulator of acetoin/glycerol metabolism